jgi:hypothetical protein
MKDKDTEKTGNPLEITEKEKQDEYIDVFKYFENANRRNREAFSELLNYTMENRRD